MLSIEDCFLDDSISPRDQFIKFLETLEMPTNATELQHTITRKLLTTMLDDTKSIHTLLDDALDQVDLSLPDDDLLHSNISTWRNNFSQWRKALIHQISVCTYASTSLDTLARNTHNSQAGINLTFVEELAMLSSIKFELERMCDRVKSTFEAIMSTMSIVESQKAIKEAETVTKLTQLAFFFIPISFIATVFGANVVVSKHLCHRSLLRSSNHL